jgi:tRNA(Ile)-lysidine synthase
LTAYGHQPILGHIFGTVVVRSRILSPARDSLFEYVLQFIRDNNLMPPGETVVVGVSGGTDSVCMLHLLYRMRSELQIDLHVAHLNHTLRGDESKGDAEYVSGLARKLGLSISTEERDVRGHRVQNRLTLEEAAREVRYQFFAGVAQRAGAHRVAVGHTADDQAETIMMRLIRGAGATGLQGMQPATEWRTDTETLVIVRPLLRIERQQTELYCHQHDLAPRTDLSNFCPSNFRNRVRLELMPLLRKYNPKINEALMRTADTLASELSLAEEQVSQVWAQVIEAERGAISINRQAILSLHPALQRHLLRRVIKCVLGDLEDIEWKHVERLRLGLSLRKGKRVILPRRLTLYVGREWCRVATD